MQIRNNKKKLVIIAAITFSVVFSLLFKWIQTGNPFKPETIIFGIIILSMLFINGYLGYAILSKMTNKTSAEIKKKVIPSFLLFTLLAFIATTAVLSIVEYSYILIMGYNTGNFINHLYTVELKPAIKQFSIWILLTSSFFFYMIWRNAIEREQKLREENLKFRYQILKNQVNPHFLFNTLNILSELVYIDAEKSEEFIQNLSSIYRYILENENVDSIELEKEISFVKQYFSLQKARDGNKIKLEIDISGSKGIKVVPVSLQILVENALKHNARSEEKPLIIKIEEKSGELIVSNPVHKKSIPESSTRTGLINLKSRTKIITGKDLVINEENNFFTVKLPTLS